MNWKRTLVIPWAVCAGLVIMASGETTAKSSGGSGSGGSSNPAKDDARLSSCSTDSLGQLSAKVTITNHSSKSSNYMVTVVFESSDGATQLDSSFAAANNLSPNQNTTVEAVSFKEPQGRFTCRITDVTRYAS